MRGYRSEALEVLRGTQRGTRYCCSCFTQLHTGVYSQLCPSWRKRYFLFDLSVCLTSHATIFQLYMWRHIDVQTEWRSLTYRQGCPTFRSVARSCDRRVKMCDKRLFKYDPFFWQIEQKITVLQNFRCLESKSFKFPQCASFDHNFLINTPSLSETPYYALGTITCR